jgi:hypothetical protein
LLGEAPLPSKAFLMLVACTDAQSQGSFFVPGGNWKTNDHSVGFGARGLLFILLISRTTPSWQRRLSMTNNANRWITSYDCTKHRMWKLKL